MGIEPSGLQEFTPMLPARNRVCHLDFNGDALCSPHFFEPPECCKWQVDSPLDILLASSTLRYQPSKIDKPRDLLYHPTSQSHLQFLMLFSYRLCFVRIYLQSDFYAVIQLVRPPSCPLIGRCHHCVGDGAPVNFCRRQWRAAGPKKSAAARRWRPKNIFQRAQKEFRSILKI